MIFSRKKTLITMAVALCITCQLSYAEFVPGGVLVTPSVYTVHISALAFVKAAGGGIVPFFSGTSDFNIAAAASGAGVGNYGQGVSMTPGVYSGMQFTMGRSMSVVATGTDDLGQTCHTAAGMGTMIFNGMTISLGSTNPNVPTTAEEISIPNNDSIDSELQQQAGMETLSDGSLRGTKTFDNGNITISSSSSTIKLIFGVTNAVEIKGTGIGSCVILPNEPALSAT